MKYKNEDNTSENTQINQAYGLSGRLTSKFIFFSDNFYQLLSYVFPKLSTRDHQVSEYCQSDNDLT